jgi:heat shock protein HslJ
MERISVDDLNGTSWTLVELNYEQPALPDTDLSISFQENQINGSGGCNNFNSSFELGSENPLMMTIRPVAVTKMACPEPILDQETAYFSALEDVSQWGYYFGRLALYYGLEQGGLGRLLFLPQQ